MHQMYPPFTPPTLLRWVFSVLVLAFLLTFSASVHAQANSSISGRVTNRAGVPIKSAKITASTYHAEGNYWSSTHTEMYTDANGMYTFPLTANSTARLHFWPPSASLSHNAFYGGAIHAADATSISVGSGEHLTGYDIALPDKAKVVGKVVDQNGVGIPEIEVQLFEEYMGNGPNDLSLFSKVNTDNEGDFTFFISVHSPYYLFFYDKNPTRYIGEYYDNKSAGETPQPLPVEINETLTLTIELRAWPTIRGIVTDEQGNPVPEIVVTAYGNHQHNSPSAQTNAEGKYVLHPLSPGQYRLEFKRFTRIVAEYYPDRQSLETAQIIDLRNTNAFTANATVTHFGYITGRVTDVHGEPLEGIPVRTFSWYGDEWEDPGDYVYTNANGEYRVIGRPWTRGSRVEFSTNYVPERPFYVREYYPNALSVEAGQSITVPVETTVPNINVIMRSETEVEADFNRAAISGTAPLAVGFTDLSQGGVLEQQWNFGDATTSAEINPTHVYTTGGIYTVTLTVTGTTNSHTLAVPAKVTVLDTPIVDLEIEQSNPVNDPDNLPTVGQTLYFSATAGGSGITYLWDFGDETARVATTATGQYVQHSYAAPGDYTVTLTARNGANEEVATIQLTVQEDDDENPGEEPVSALTLHAPSTARVNESIAMSATVGAGENVVYSWNFGDGTTATGQSVQHSYAAPGDYTITLTASNGAGKEVATMQLTVTEAPNEGNVLHLPSLHVSAPTDE